MSKSSVSTGWQCGTFLLLSAASSAAFCVTLSVVPQEAVVSAGASSSFDVRIDGLGDQQPPSLGAYQVEVGFDAAVIGVGEDDVVFGSQLGDSTSRVTAESGTLTLIEVSFVDPRTLEVNQEGSFSLAEVRFTANELGVSPLELSEAVLSDAFGLPIADVAIESSGVEVRAVDESPSEPLPPPAEPLPPPALNPEATEVATAYVSGCSELVGREEATLTAGERGLLETCASLIALSPSERSALLDEAVPRIQKPAARIGIGANQQQSHNVSMRLTELRGGAVGFTTAGLLLPVHGQPIDGNQVAALLGAVSGGGASGDEGLLGGPWGFFLNGNVAQGDRDRTQREDGFDFDLYNITAGVDYRLSDELILGAALGYSNTNADFDDSPNRTDVEGWSVMLYGTYMPTEEVYVDAMISRSWDQYDVRRLDPFSGLTANGDTDGSAFSANLGAGYDLNRDQWTFGPYGRLSYVSVDVDGYQESSVAGNEYRFEDQDAESLTLAFGGRVSYAISTGYGVVVPEAWVDWTHEFSNDGDILIARLVNDPTQTPIGLATDEPDRDFVHAGLGASAQFGRGRSAYLLYERLFAHSYLSSGTLQAGVRLEF